MKSKLFTLILIGLLVVPMSSGFGFIGFGLTVLQEMGSVDGYEESMTEGFSEAIFTRDAFDNPVGIGGYLYIDIIPIVDLEMDFQIAAATYAFNFSTYANDILLAGTPAGAEFAYARGSFYLTARKKLVGVGVPILGGVKIHAGGGLNFHKTAPYMSIDLMQELLGDDLYAEFDQSAMEDKILDYVEDNLESATGIHFQVGVQLKLLILDMFVNYRYTIAKDVFEDQSGFGALNFRLGMGF